MDNTFFNESRVLVVEDDMNHSELIELAFQKRAPHVAVQLASTVADARKILIESSPDLVITDLMLPDGRGIDLIDKESELLGYPLIVMTSQGNEQMAVDALKRGALDYVVKTHESLMDMPHIAETALRQWRHIVERKKAELALKEAYDDLERRVAERTIELDTANSELQSSMEELCKTEVALRRSEQQSRVLSHRLISMMEQERARLARELHDELGQQLSTMAMEIEWLKRQQTPSKEHIESLAGSLDNLHQELRRLCRGLHPMILDRLGVSLAIESLIEEYRGQTNLEIDCWLDEIAIEAVPQDTAVSIYRIFQESMTNIIRHAKAGNVKVRLKRRGDFIKLLVSDDGVGFDSSESFDNTTVGIGIIGMNERALICGAELEVTSKPGQGTTVSLSVPVKS